MSMFRICMNDGWTEVMYVTMNEVYSYGIPFLWLTALFFIFFHLLINSVRDNKQTFKHEHERSFFFASV